MAQPVEPAPAARYGWKILLGVLAAGAAIVAITAAVLFSSSRGSLSPQECEKLESEKNQALGFLENATLGPKRPLHLAEADALFEAIARQRPGDPLGLRNLVITRLLRLEKAEDGEKQHAIRQARQAAEQLLASDDSPAVAHVLAARVAALSGDNALAAAELARAGELDPHDASLWYETYELLKDLPDKSLHPKADAALGRAFEAAPDNLFVALVWAEVQASRKDPTITRTLAALRKTLETMPGMLAQISNSTRHKIPDVLTWLDEASQAAEINDWPTVLRHLRPLDSPLKSQTAAQSDLRRIKRHALEYVIHEFKDRCARSSGDQAAHARVDVKLVEFAATEQLPTGLLGITDVDLADLDLDDRLDVVVLRGSILEVYSRVNGGGWRRIVDAQLPAGYDRLLIADFDQDNPKQPGTEAHRQAQRHASQQPAKKREAGGDESLSAEPGAKDACHFADLDIAVYGQAGILLFRNELNFDTGARTLEPVEQPEALTKLTNIRVLMAADLYHDGNLDLVLAGDDGLHLWSNDGDMSFTDITAGAQLPDSLHATALVVVDWDRDVDLDILVANASGEPAGYLENLRHAQFRWRPFEKGFDALSHANALALFDGEASGSWDFATSGEPGVHVIRTDISRAGRVSPLANAQLTRSARNGIVVWDFDNDSYADLLAWGNKTIDFFRGNQEGDQSVVPPLLTGALQDVRACRIGDFDDDGDQDLAVAEADRIVLYSNEGGNRNHWLDINLRADIVDDQTRSLRADHYGLGSIVEVRSGSRVQRQIVSGQTNHFGLGDEARADVVRVTWTTGVPQNLTEPQTDLVICDEQVITGSCPYLYTWDGDNFVFCTDLLWSAPLGLQLAEGVLAPSRSWEYLRIPGEVLKPRDGQYQLRITEELWEAAYFDQVKLIAVDHPADVEIYSNEKVGPAEIADFKVHTVRKPIRPVAARDQRGRDLLERIARRDGVYVKAFDRQVAFGLAEDHYVELDFGDLGGRNGTESVLYQNPRQMTLFLTGWIFPSGTSMNVAISRNPKLDDPRPPSLWVPDADGQWREVRPYMGFPGGKTKTIAVDLSDVFLTDDYRLRIATNMEIFWDEAFLTVDEAPATIELKELPLNAADLHYRGFSHRSPGKNFGPEQYDYDRVNTVPKWAPMQGNFTRYGPVEELLIETDDLLAIVGAGDEISLSFTVPANDPPEGWKRDFLLYNVGWDKDCDLNTVYGETVEPLPFAAMSGYPYGGDESYPDTERHRQYLRTYQTRTQDPGGFWRNIFDAASN